MLNNVAISGRMASDVELRKSKTKGKNVTNFTIIVPRDNDYGEADKIPCIAWDRNAELVAGYCGKGKKVTVSGRLETRVSNGIYVIELNAKKIYFDD